MKRFITAIIVTVSTTFLIVILLNLLPREKKTVRGEIVSIKQGGGENDIVFKLKDDSKTYYINRGLQYGLNLDTLERYFLDIAAELSFNKTLLLSSPYPIIAIVSGERTVSRGPNLWEIR